MASSERYPVRGDLGYVWWDHAKDRALRSSYLYPEIPDGQYYGGDRCPWIGPMRERQPDLFMKHHPKTSEVDTTRDSTVSATLLQKESVQSAQPTDFRPINHLPITTPSPLNCPTNKIEYQINAMLQSPTIATPLEYTAPGGKPHDLNIAQHADNRGESSTEPIDEQIVPDNLNPPTNRTSLLETVRSGINLRTLWEEPEGDAGEGSDGESLAGVVATEKTSPRPLSLISLDVAYVSPPTSPTVFSGMQNTEQTAQRPLYLSSRPNSIRLPFWGIGKDGSVIPHDKKARKSPRPGAMHSGGLTSPHAVAALTTLTSPRGHTRTTSEGIPQVHIHPALRKTASGSDLRYFDNDVASGNEIRDLQNFISEILPGMVASEHSTDPKPASLSSDSVAASSVTASPQETGALVATPHHHDGTPRRISEDSDTLPTSGFNSASSGSRLGTPFSPFTNPRAAPPTPNAAMRWNRISRPSHSDLIDSSTDLCASSVHEESPGDIFSMSANRLLFPEAVDSEHSLQVAASQVDDTSDAITALSPLPASSATTIGPRSSPPPINPTSRINSASTRQIRRLSHRISQLCRPSHRTVSAIPATHTSPSTNAKFHRSPLSTDLSNISNNYSTQYYNPRTASSQKAADILGPEMLVNDNELLQHKLSKKDLTKKEQKRIRKEHERIVEKGALTEKEVKSIKRDQERVTGGKGVFAQMKLGARRVFG